MVGILLHCGFGRSIMSSDCPQQLCTGPGKVSIPFLMVLLLDMLSFGEDLEAPGMGQCHNSWS